MSSSFNSWTDEKEEAAYRETVSTCFLCCPEWTDQESKRPFWRDYSGRSEKIIHRIAAFRSHSLVAKWICVFSWILHHKKSDLYNTKIMKQIIRESLEIEKNHKQMKRSFRVASASGIRFAFQSARAVSLNALWGAESAGFGANAASTKYVEINISLAQILDCPSSLVEIFDKDRTGKDKNKETRRNETLRKRFVHDAIYQMLVAPPLGVSIADQWEEAHQCLCDRVLQLRIDILQWHLLWDTADLQRSQLYFAIWLARLESDTQLSHHYLSRIKQKCRR